MTISSQTQTQTFTFTTAPVLAHDCDCCKFLGGTIVQGQFVEYYQCEDTVIARTGNGAQDNRSFPIAFILQRDFGSSVWQAIKPLLSKK
jgi:hypothetical protein